MSLRYAHTLIAVPKDFVPSAAQVQSFVVMMLSRGVVPAEERSVVLRTPSARPRVGKNPATGEKIALAGAERKELKSAGEFAGAIGGAGEYWAEVGGTGWPKLPPLPLDLDEPYYVGVVCRVSSVLRSTSSLEEERKGVEFYDEPHKGKDHTGYFTHPDDPELILKVAEAGCARFWIEFELGNSVFPIFDNPDSLDLLDESIVADAKRAFGIDFVQGCSWG
jgi:hypothetical protein